MLRGEHLVDADVKHMIAAQPGNAEIGSRRSAMIATKGAEAAARYSRAARRARAPQALVPGSPFVSVTIQETG